MDWASKVEVVVPSPACSAVLIDACLTICAPMFSTLSSSSMDFATVTPSFVEIGLPADCSMITFLPEGPKVAVTALASLSTPWINSCLALSENLITLLIVFYLFYYCKNFSILGNIKFFSFKIYSQCSNFWN